MMKRLTKKRNLDQDLAFKEEAEALLGVSKEAVGVVVSVKIPISNPEIGLVRVKLVDLIISRDVQTVSDVEQLALQALAAVGLVAALLAVKILQDLVTGHALMPPVAIPTLPFVQNAIAVTLLALMGAATQLVVAVAEDSEEEEIVDAGHSVAEAAAEVHSVAIEEAEDEGVLEIEEGGAASGEGVVAVRALILKPLVQGKTKR